LHCSITAYSVILALHSSHTNISTKPYTMLATSIASKPADYRRTHFPHETLTPITCDILPSSPPPPKGYPRERLFRTLRPWRRTTWPRRPSLQRRQLRTHLQCSLRPSTFTNSCHSRELSNWTNHGRKQPHLQRGPRKMHGSQPHRTYPPQPAHRNPRSRNHGTSHQQSHWRC
jgi:hypothetical protein